jgi:oligosaccharide repeat unit polymerase
MQVADGFRGPPSVGPGWPATRHLPAARRGYVAWAPAGATLAAGVAFFSLFIATGSSSNLQCAAAFMITAVPFVISAGEAPSRLLQPLSLFGFTMLLGVAGQTVYLTHSDPSPSDDLLSGLTTTVLTPGLLVAALGVAALAIGYLAGRPKNFAPRLGGILQRGVRLGLGAPSPSRAFWVVSVLCAVSVAAFALYAPQVGIHTPSDLLSSQKRYALVAGGHTTLGYHRFVMSFAGIGFIFAVYTLVRQRVSWYSRLGAIAIVALILTAAYANITSSRTDLFGTVAMAAFVTIALRRREPRPALVAAVVAAALLALAIIGGERKVNTGQAPSLSSTLESGALVENAIGSREWMAIGPISVLVDRVPSNYPYQYGKTMVSALWAPIPKTLWPGKPPTRLGPVVSPAVFGFSVDRRTGDPTGVLGELWLNGGVIAVVIGMALLGVLLRRVDVWYRLVSATDGLTAIPYGVFIVILALSLPLADVTGALARLLEYLSALALMLWIARRRSPTAHYAQMSSDLAAERVSAPYS